MIAPVKKKKPTVIDAKDISMITARLAQLLAEEVDLLDAMNIRNLEKLQEEKLFLLDALETYKRLFKQQPTLSETIPSRDKHDLGKVVELFENISEENHRKLLMAKEVNEQMVKAIGEVVAEKTQTPYYGNRGMKEAAIFENTSVTLNEQI